MNKANILNIVYIISILEKQILHGAVKSHIWTSEHVWIPE